MMFGFLVACLWAGTPLPFPDQPDVFLDITTGPGELPIFFIAPHENERVINDYVAETVAKKGGKLLIIRQHGERHLRLHMKKSTWELDPNRMFTPRGARQSLLRLNTGLGEHHPDFQSCHDRALAIGQFVLAQCKGLGPKASVIALHNNTDGYDQDGKQGMGTISIQRYLRKLEAGAAYIQAVHAGDGDEDDLFFITEPEDYARMKAAGWNVVLQHPQVATRADEDDGSLSVLAEKKGWRYINIEAQRKPGDDHLDVQRRMVDFVCGFLYPQ